MNKRNQTYFVFAIATTVFALIGTLFVLLFALNSPDSVEGYPTYTYEEYIDHTQDRKLFYQDGAQIYESEDFPLSYGATLSESVSASGYMSVFSESKGASLICPIESDANMNVKLTLCLSYISSNHKNIDAKKVIDIRINSEKVSLSGVEIQSSYNNLEYLENDICILPIRKGKNTLEILSATSDDLYIDYFVLTTNVQKKRDEETSLDKSNHFTLYSRDDRQVMEAELAKKEKAIAIEDKDAGNSSAVYLADEGDKVTFPIYGEIQTSANCSLVLKRASRLNACSLRITVNNQKSQTYNYVLTSNYSEQLLRTFTFRRGENSLTIENISGVAFLDCLILNCDYTFSEKNTNYAYQAEDAYIDGGNIINDENALGGKAVSNNFISSSINFEVRSTIASSTTGVLRLAYCGVTTRLSDILDVTFNGNSLSLFDVMLQTSNTMSNYISVSLGSLSLRRGLNVLQIISQKNNSYNLDALVLTNYEITENNHSRIEAESILSSRNGSITFGLNSQENYSQYMIEGDTLEFYFHSNQRISLNVSLVLSLNDKDSILSSEEFSFFVNGKEATILDTNLQYGTRMHLFTTANFGNFSITSGINVLSLKCRALPIFIDSLIFSW